MVNYQDGKIYKIIDNTNNNVYVGSTCKNLSSRLADHRTSYKRYLKGAIRYITSFDVIKNNDYDIVLIEKCPCDDKDELHKRERFYIENTPNCVNKVIPTRTGKEYEEHNKDNIRVRKLEYRIKHFELIIQKRKMMRKRLN